MDANTLLHWLFFVYLCSKVTSQKSESNTTLVEDVFKLIEEGLAQQPPNPSGKAILLVGLTGAGKTTLAKLITGDNSKLVAVPVTNKFSVTTTQCPDDDYFYAEENPNCEDVDPIVDYQIIDKDDDKIGTNSTVSKTFYPEQYVDLQNYEVIIDCPGFQDTRTESHEIAIAVFMQSIFTWAKETKIVVVVNHADVRTGASRTEFPRLLKAVTILLKNSDVFTTSVGMIVTKVTNEYSNNKVANDDQMIKHIAEYLKRVKNEQEDPNGLSSKLLNSLLKPIGSKYPNIAIFRRPYEAGPLSNNSAIQTGNLKIRKMLYQNLKYANIPLTDIGFAVTGEAEIVIMEMGKQIKATIESMIKSLKENFANYYANKINQFRNYDELRDTLEMEKDWFDISSLVDDDFGVQLKWFFYRLNAHRIYLYRNQNEAFELLLTQFKYITFLREMSNKDEVKPDPKWSTVVPGLVQHLTSRFEWYRFLVSAFDRLSQNDVQSKKKDLIFDTLKHWNDFKKYIFKNLKWPHEVKISEKKTTLDELEQKSLMDILHSVLDQPTSRFYKTKADRCHLEVEGYFVRISELKNQMKLCNGYPISVFYVFAQYTIFFDESFDLVGSEMLLGMIAPRWEVIGSPTINLNGKTAEEIETIPIKGRHGQPGRNGGQAGTFFGVGLKFDKSEYLKIYTSGGSGGNGQAGSKGANGHGDMNVRFLHKWACDNCKHMKSSYVKCITDEKLYYCGDYHSYSGIKQKATITINSGPEAETGYNGGKPGYGGFNGISSQIINLQDPVKSTIINTRGRRGLPGIGGQGGAGSLNGYMSIKAHWDIILFIPIYTCTHTFYRSPPKPKAPKGYDGYNGVLKEPPRTEHNTPKIISVYRTFVENRASDPSIVSANSAHKQFLNTLNNHANIKERTNIQDLIYEFIELEKINQQRSGIKELTSIYNMLMQLIRNTQRYDSSNSFLITSNYLYATILARKFNVENDITDNLIIDVSVFVNHIRRQVEEFMTLEQNRRIGGLQQIYKDDIVKKQQEADVFIAKQFGEEMAKIDEKINTAIAGLLDEINVLMKQLEAERNRYLEYVRKLERAMVFNAIFGALKTATSFLGFLGPTGVLNDVVKLGSNVGSMFAPNPTPGSTKLLDALKKMKQFQNGFFDTYNRKTRSLLRHISSVSTTNPAIVNILFEVETEVRGLISKNESLSLINEQFPKIVEKSKTKHNVTESKELKEMVGSFTLAYNNMATTYKDISKSLSEHDVAMIVLEQYEEMFKKLRAYEELVDNSLRSYMNDLTHFLSAIIDGKKDASAVALEIARYNIKEVLRDVKGMISSFTTGFDAREDLVACIESLENLMITSINVYDQVQTYNDQINLADFFANINTLSPNGVDTGDQNLNSLISQLDHTLLSNTIRNQFNRAASAFLQLVFPFASLFLNDIQLPSTTVTPKIDQELQQVIMKLKRMEQIIADQQSSVIQGYDEQIFTGVFDEESPFFIWNTTAHNRMITALLQGKEVTLNADIAFSAANAVKFNDIRLNVKTTGDQKMLNQILQKYHIKLSHLGNSRYRCQDRAYIIASQPLDIEYSFAMDKNGQPITTNVAYNKIRDGDILLSPYAVWRFQIVNRYRSSVDDLAQFHGKTSLVLTGKGQYVKRNNPICNKNLETNYQFDKYVN